MNCTVCEFYLNKIYILTRRQEETFVGDGYITTVIVMISQMYPYLKIYKIVQFKYMKLIVYLLYPIKLFLKITYSEHLETSRIHIMIYPSNLFSMNTHFSLQNGVTLLFFPLGNIS